MRKIYVKFLSSAVYKNPVIQSSFIDSKRKQAVERRIRNIMNPEVKRNFKKVLWFLLYRFFCFLV